MVVPECLDLPAEGTNGVSGFKVLTRGGEALAKEGDFKGFRQAAAFPKTMLHPSIADKVWLVLARGDLDDAVFAAFKAVEIAVREVGHFTARDYGTDLMRKAFSPDEKNAGPLTDKSQLEAERKLSLIYSLAQSALTKTHTLTAP
jgi:Protein of unknown function (Hypoth_ymh)